MNAQDVEKAGRQFHDRLQELMRAEKEEIRQAVPKAVVEQVTEIHKRYSQKRTELFAEMETAATDIANKIEPAVVNELFIKLLGGHLYKIQSESDRFTANRIASALKRGYEDE